MATRLIFIIHEVKCFVLSGTMHHVSFIKNHTLGCYAECHHLCVQQQRQDSAVDFGWKQRVEKLRGGEACNVKSPSAAGCGIYCGAKPLYSTCELSARCHTFSRARSINQRQYISRLGAFHHPTFHSYQALAELNVMNHGGDQVS